MIESKPYPLQRIITGQFLVFSAIGLANTSIHIGTVVLLVENRWTQPMPANVAAFFLANGFSYFANTRLNFRVEATPRRYLNFLFISLLGLSLTIVLTTITESLGWHYLASMALVVALMPFLSFWLQRRFTFR